MKCVRVALPEGPCTCSSYYCCCLVVLLEFLIHKRLWLSTGLYLQDHHYLQHVIKHHPLPSTSVLSIIIITPCSSLRLSWPSLAPTWSPQAVKWLAGMPTLQYVTPNSPQRVAQKSNLFSWIKLKFNRINSATKFFCVKTFSSKVVVEVTTPITDDI